MQRFNSIIKIKVDACIDCGRVTKIHSLKRCAYCYRLFNNKARQDKVRERRLVNEERQHNLDIWFEAIGVNVIEPNPYCWECGAWIPPKYYRAATCHIFRKRVFASVETHPQNFVIAAAGCCHYKTEDWDKFAQMKIWQTALERIKIIYPHITEYQKNNLPEFLLKLIN